ncbi:c-type cytochrome [Flavobacteriales bacterium AH-315-E23]|nr:c-type cytochrome [Flavobacteriales bacterium AH-315-E23]
MVKILMRLSSFLRSLSPSASNTKFFTLLSIFFILATITVPKVYAWDGDAEAGEKIFKSSCATCHYLGGGPLTGPDLEGVRKRIPKGDWVYRWIRNSQDVIKSGDVYANKIFEENDKRVMQSNALSDEEIDNVLAYIDAYEPPAAPGAEAKNPYIDGNVHPVDHSEKHGLLTVIAVLVILLFMMAGAKLSLKKINAELRDGEEPSEKSVVDGFLRWMGANKRWVALCVLISLAVVARAAWFGLLYVNVGQGYEPEQPIWFSHQIHAGKNGINCVYCHSGAEKSRTAGIPSANVCMNCHKAIKTGTFTGDQEIPKIYKALDYDPEKDEYGDNPTPIKWVKVHNLPDLAYFNHSQHVVVGEIECQQCHGPVEEMHVMRQESMLTMGWCIDCHRNTEVKMEGNEYYTELHKNLMEKYPGEKITVDKMGGIDCARCHY